ncbi:Acyl-CoA thioesterase II [Pseudonocardia sp. Ae168_Ps1]|uniref:acyl-CoA thioesterase n=1 Tax=unclassified Pseudonocardia TaxID=2619320 RepID=UPI0006CB73C1|nr:MULTISPECIES: acyl-CoA thioesterase II [unclassified Pseudonocardia]ALE74035.1 acyl-CoA thioesterase [Pseudonocardia sp. EC080625-04]ALL77444.1 acyl-CoA thioesterase [Pseudonocardia sp. EC080610-09]ALL80359.1 acyl-CoA thioesterase [Pseudonocardia sp. EC080619-01]OLL71163.1 Acyl-CoA thioesterase II [Pseudonocardia sp. Ae168_Ps1]OLL77287.1 Acyl-CoA thioesterase II [Pseudonocardia sp. Ae150A_Ps1]
MSPAEPVPATEPQATAADGEPRGQAVLDDLVSLLDLERLEDNLFRGVSPPVSLPRVFGGQVAGQALVAAGRTVPGDRPVHSLHAYFIRPGDPNIPIVYETERVRDGRSFTTRRVLAIQRGEAIFSLSASFQMEQDGLRHSEPMPQGVPAPDRIDDLGARAVRGDGGWMAGLPRPLDIRLIDEPVSSQRWTGPSDEPMRLWLRADGTLPDEKLLHVCLLTYASDLTLLGSVVARHDAPANGVQMASLDHAMWFHEPFRADEWLLYTCYSPAASGGRGLASGRFFTADGRLVATTMQEGLVRVRKGGRR